MSKFRPRAVALSSAVAALTLVLVPSSAFASGPLSVSDVTVTATPITDGTSNVLSLNWSVPDNSPAGAVFVHSGLAPEFTRSDSETAQLRNPAGDIVADAVWSGDAITLTLAPYVSEHPVGIGGTITLTSNETRAGVRELLPEVFPENCPTDDMWSPRCETFFAGEQGPGEYRQGHVLHFDDGSISLVEFRLPYATTQAVPGALHVQFQPTAEAPYFCEALQFYEYGPLGTGSGTEAPFSGTELGLAIEDYECTAAGVYFVIPDGIPAGHGIAFLTQLPASGATTPPVMLESWHEVLGAATFSRDLTGSAVAQAGLASTGSNDSAWLGAAAVGLVGLGALALTLTRASRRTPSHRA